MIESHTNFGVGEFEDVYQRTHMTKVSKTHMNTYFYNSLCHDYFMYQIYMLITHMKCILE